MGFEVGTQPVYEGAGTLGVATTANTLTIPYPSSIAEDDLLVCAIGLRNYITVTRPSEWAEWDYNTTSNIRSYIWGSRADGTETGSLGPLTHGTAVPVVGVIIRISGILWGKTTDYEDYAEDTWGVSTTCNIPTIESYNLARLAFAFLFTGGNNTLSDDGAEWVEEFDYQTSSGSGFSIGGYSIDGPSKGTIDPDTVTISASAFNHTWAFNVRPPLYTGIANRMKIDGIEIGTDDDQVGSYMGVNVSDIRKITNSNGTQD